MIQRAPSPAGVEHLLGLLVGEEALVGRRLDERERERVVDDAALDAWRAFLTAHAPATRRISRDLVAEGLPDLGWYDLLWALRRSPGQRLRVNELAREVMLSPTALSRFVDRAVAPGVVAREPDPDDRRASQVGLTDEAGLCCGG